MKINFAILEAWIMWKLLCYPKNQWWKIRYKLLKSKMEMKPEQITEGNKLIAEFLGGNIRGNSANEYVWSLSMPEFYCNKMSANHHVSELKFHSSWDWLIPAVKKCKETDPLIYLGTDLVFHITSFNIDGVWNQVVAFIRYYNKKK